MASSFSTETELIEAARDGNRRAFGQLVESHAPRLMSLSLKMLASRSDAEDVVQEAFASAWLSLKKFDLSQPFEPWLTTIALNKARDALRRRRTARLFGGKTDGLEVPSPAAAPDVEVEDRSLLADVQRSIARLPTRLREPFVLVVLEGWSQAEAATLLSVSEKTVETRIYRARKALKKKFSLS